MGNINSKSHLPYAVRYMARLQEQAAQTVVSKSLSTDRLQKCAEHLRETAHLIGRVTPPVTVDVAHSAPQKIKLLDFLRQQGLTR